jgi:hypothetical protein
MKTIKLLAIGIALVLAGIGYAQVSVNIKIGVPPPWGPVGFSSVHYYYLPDVEAYYDVQSSMFIYFGDGKWIHRSYLPGRYRNYDLYGGYKVVMTDYHGNTPYTHFKEHKSKYGRGYHGSAQRTIGPKPGKANPNGNNPHPGDPGNVGGHGNDKGGGRGNDKGHGNDKGGGHDNGNGKKK